MGKSVAAQPWWTRFQVIGYVVGGCLALGTGILMVSKYIALPERVEAMEATNEKQDDAINRLVTLQEFYATQSPMAQQARPAPPQGDPPLRTWQDSTGVWWCCTTRCDLNDAWWQCE